MKKVSAVPRWVLGCLGAGLLLQAFTHASLPAVSPRAESLPSPPPARMLEISALGENILLSKLLMLYLQAFDAQPGLLIRYRDLDYDKVEEWLASALQLDPKGQYPLFAAGHFYAMIDSPAKVRKMLEFIHREFLADPDGRWQWQALAVVLAKHELKDLPLALRYAESLRRNTREVMPWAKEMQAFVLEDMNETQSAKILLGGLVAAGKIKDPNEIAYLKREIARLESVENASAKTDSGRKAERQEK